MIRVAVIHMRNEALLFGHGCEEFFKGNHVDHLRKPALFRLLHGADGKLLQAIERDGWALRGFATNESDLVNADLGDLLHQPLHPVHVLGGGDDEVNTGRAPGNVLHSGDRISGLALVNGRERCVAVGALAIGQLNRVTRAHAKDARDMAGFFRS